MSDQPADARAVEEAATVDDEAVSGAVPGRDGGPADEEAMAAAEGLEASESVQKAYGDMLERGAEQKGEGRVP